MITKKPVLESNKYGYIDDMFCPQVFLFFFHFFPAPRLAVHVLFFNGKVQLNILRLSSLFWLYRVMALGLQALLKTKCTSLMVHAPTRIRRKPYHAVCFRFCNMHGETQANGMITLNRQLLLKMRRIAQFMHDLKKPARSKINRHHVDLHEWRKMKPVKVFN